MSGRPNGCELSASLLFETRHELAEAPLWYNNRWWWVDIEGGSLNSGDDSGGDVWSHSFGQRLGAAAPLLGKGFLLALERGLAIWDLETDSLEYVAHPDQEIAGNRCNDGKWDPFGRFVVGTLNMQGKPHQGALYSFEFPNKLTKRLSNVSVSNGLAWTKDGRTLYHIDTLQYEVTAYDYDLSTGELSCPRVVIRTPAEMGYPDGMDIDAAGNLWVAHWNDWVVRCWSPQSGECLSKIRLPCSRPTSCCFGGLEGNDLIITTARVGLSMEDLAREPQAGSVFIQRAVTAGGGSN